MRVALLAFISALFAACIVAPVQAQQSGADLAKANDINALNYALALEKLEATYYSCLLAPLVALNSDCAGRGYTAFNQTDFANAGYNASVFNAFLAIGLQELSHVTFLSGVISGAGGTPVPRCVYNLNALQSSGVTTVAQFLSLSSVLESTGVSAYAGAVNAITNTDYQQAAVQIASVEARHAAWLAQLLGTQPFASSGFDTYYTPTQVAAIVGPALGSADCVSTLPTTRPFGVAAAGTGTNYTGTYSSLNGLSYTAIQRQNDIKTLNYALMLEELEANFYYNASLLFNQSTFTNAGYSVAAYNNFQIIGANEQTHVTLLRIAITALGGTPVQNCTYNFGTALASFQSYLTTAQILETAGAMAYTGAANTITDTNLQRTAATIAMIEARHAAYISALISNPKNDTMAFPMAFENAVSPQNTVSAVLATQLIQSAASCPFTIDANFFPNVFPQAWGIPNGTIVYPSSSSGGSIATSTGRNGASSSSAFSLMMIVASIIASLALVL